MTRPETVDDLTEAQRRGPEFASFDLGAFPFDGDLIRKAMDFLDLANLRGNRYPFEGVEVAREGTRINCYATPSERDLLAKLEIAQRTWDQLDGRWLAAKSGAPRDHFAYAITEFCIREGRELPWNEPAVTE